MGRSTKQTSNAGDAQEKLRTRAKSLAGRLGISAGTGLQGKLVLCFMFLLTVALGASCWLFVSESKETFDGMACEQAQQLSRTLAMASEPPIERGDTAELQRIGAELMKNRGIAALAFFDSAGQQLAVAARDPDLEQPNLSFFPNPRSNPIGLTELHSGWTASLGRYVQLTTPVTRINSRTSISSPARPVGQVIGFVTVCVSQAVSDVRARNVTLMVVLIGAGAVLVSLPTMYLLVHRIFSPIRQLVQATDRIAAGDLATCVAIDRPDVIGTLARSFNKMVNRVCVQQKALESANAQLEQANRSLAEANRGLEEKIRQRTVQLERANHRLSSEMTEKDEFLRTVSHDLNGPLRNISGMAAMLLMKHRESFDADVVHRLERIQKNVELETDLIAELLELSRIKSRRQKFEEVELADLVAEVGELFAQDLESHCIGFTIDPELPTLTCERSRLRQVFQNLVDNAIKYMGQGSTPGALATTGWPHAAEADAAGRVRAIHVGMSPRGEDELEFYVRDSGLGIDEADVDNVFRVFRRGKSAAVQSVAGKGVGLASVKSIVEMYGGSVRLESRSGSGSTFRFTIDRKHLAGQGPPRASAKAA